MQTLVWILISQIIMTSQELECVDMVEVEIAIVIVQWQWQFSRNMLRTPGPTWTTTFCLSLGKEMRWFSTYKLCLPKTVLKQHIKRTQLVKILQFEEVKASSSCGKAKQKFSSVSSSDNSTLVLSSLSPCTARKAFQQAIGKSYGIAVTSSDVSQDIVDLFVTSMLQLHIVWSLRGWSRYWSSTSQVAN